MDEELEELLLFINHWIEHYQKLYRFQKGTFLMEEDKNKLIVSMERAKMIVNKYVGILIDGIEIG